jgi:hypothetical protein
MSGIVYVTFVIGDSCFSVAVWLLAHNYFVCSQKLQVVDLDPQASGRESEVKPEPSSQILKWTMLTLNIGTSLAWGTFRLLKNLACYWGEANQYKTQEVIA